MAIAAALLLLYWAVLLKLARDWMSDPNYSHGLIVPFVIGYIVWLDLDAFGDHKTGRSKFWLGLSFVALALFMLLAGTLGAELFIQRLSLIVMLAGVVVYFFGMKILRRLVVPFALLLFSIPIPEIVFNKIAFPLQLLATRIADWGIGLFGIATVRTGNIIELMPVGESTSVALEVVEACSGIRSLMTLVSLALILGYFTRQRRARTDGEWFGFSTGSDVLRTVLLMLSAVPIALLTNGVRVMITGIMTYYYGRQAAEGSGHDAAGWLVFLSALVLLGLVNQLLLFFRTGDGQTETVRERQPVSLPLFSKTSGRTVYLLVILLAGAVAMNWFQQRSELSVQRKALSEMPVDIGEWRSKGNSMRFDEATEKVLRADDYIMRYYFSPQTWINFYVGYYGSQRTGSTYHSPLNCLPGGGWEMKEPATVEVRNPSGGSFTANYYLVQRGKERQILVYWYQGRGRRNASEYTDKIYTTIDAMAKNRSDGSFVRIMAPEGADRQKSLEYLLDFASKVSEELEPFVPN